MNKIGFTDVVSVQGTTRVPMWAEFKYDIGGKDVLFRVTSPFMVNGRRHQDGEFQFIVTHVASGHRFSFFGFDVVARTRFNAGRNNYGRAGAESVSAMIKKYGLARIMKAQEPYENE